MISLEELPKPAPSFIPGYIRNESERLAVSELRVLRGELFEEGMPKAMIDLIDRTIREITVWSNFTVMQLDEIVLFAIEEKALFLITEITDELAIHRRVVVESVERLEKEGLVYKVNRLVPGSGRPQYMYKSTRQRNVEATSAMFSVPASRYSDAAWE